MRSEDLELAVERLKAAREAMTAFRIANEIVDLTADIQGQMGLLNTLQAQLASALIDFDLLAGTARRIRPACWNRRRRASMSSGPHRRGAAKIRAGGKGRAAEDYASTVAEFESLTVDREFAETAYLAALAGYDVARAGANRQSRYLAAYIQPTRWLKRREYPQRAAVGRLVGMFSLSDLGDPRPGLLCAARPPVAGRMIRLEHLCKCFRTPVRAQSGGRQYQLTIPSRRGRGADGAQRGGQIHIAGNDRRTATARQRTIVTTGVGPWPGGLCRSFHRDMTGAQNIRFIARIYGVDTDSLVEFVQGFRRTGPAFPCAGAHLFLGDEIAAGLWRVDRDSV